MENVKVALCNLSLGGILFAEVLILWEMKIIAVKFF